jgi:hypothetical protein
MHAVFFLVSLCITGLSGAEATGASSPDDAAANRFASVVAGPAGGTRFNGGIGFIPPARWSVTESNGVVQMRGPSASPQSPCVALLLAPRPARGGPAAQAEALVNQMFAARFGGPLRSLTGADVKTDKWSRYDGESATGWQYVDLYGKLGDRRTFIYARVLLAKMGQQVVPLVGLTTDDYRCLGGSRDNATWLLLFHSLQLPGYTQETSRLEQLLPGEWQSVDATSYASESYAANGHFSWYGAHSTYTVKPGGPDVLLQKTSGWPGDGSYEVHGDRLSLTSPKGRYAGRTATLLFSIVRRPNHERPQGFEYVLRKIDRFEGGNTYAIVLARQ